ncbi:N-acetylmuramoyl-L-alanine amidase [Candidatus Sumerlaeota bacterium]|nr:N-acetylmuramoyl-L-alanine amidase [Candidatus Sumerlaeota bacterium]
MKSKFGKITSGILVFVVTLASSSVVLTGQVPPPKIKVYKHSAWSDIEPKGVDCHGVRQNLNTTNYKTLTLDDLTIVLLKAEEGTAGATPVIDKAQLQLTKGDTTETRDVNEGDAFNWNGFHIAIPAMYMKKGELGYPSTVVEAATVESLPERVASATKADGPSDRLRVKHTINKLTLHHSATPHKEGDVLATKLKNQQKWGETDRNWFDVPYHFFVDLDGTAYQARDYRYAGDTNTAYDTRGHLLINCYGNYEEAEPNEKQLETIANLMAWGAMEFKIDPIKIFGHKDLAGTSCPGKNLYKYIQDGSLEKRVQDIVKNGQKPEFEWLDKM